MFTEWRIGILDIQRIVSAYTVEVFVFLSKIQPTLSVTVIHFKILLKLDTIIVLWSIKKIAAVWIDFILRLSWFCFKHGCTALNFGYILLLVEQLLS